MTTENELLSLWELLAHDTCPGLPVKDKVMQARLALMTLLCAVSACNQAPDDDSSPAASQVDKAQQSRQMEKSRIVPISAGHGPFAATYELQGAPGEMRQFPTKVKCDAARTALDKAQAQDDKKLNAQGVVFPSRPLLVCVPN